MGEPAAGSQHYPLDELDVGELVYYAALALQQDNAADGELILRQADARFPGDGDVQLGLADVLLAGDSPQAEAQVRRAAALAAGDPVRLTRAASQLFCVGDLPAAYELALAATAVLPDEFAYAAALSHLFGRLAEAGDNNAVAERMLQSAYDAEPWHEDYGYALARHLADRDEQERAAQIVERSLVHHPDDEWLLAMRAELTAVADAGGG